MNPWPWNKCKIAQITILCSWSFFIRVVGSVSKLDKRFKFSCANNSVEKKSKLILGQRVICIMIPIYKMSPFSSVFTSFWIIQRYLKISQSVDHNFYCASEFWFRNLNRLWKVCNACTYSNCHCCTTITNSKIKDLPKLFRSCTLRLFFEKSYTVLRFRTSMNRNCLNFSYISDHRFHWIYLFSRILSENQAHCDWIPYLRSSVWLLTQKSL